MSRLLGFADMHPPDADKGWQFGWLFLQAWEEYERKMDIPEIEQKVTYRLVMHAATVINASVLCYLTRKAYLGGYVLGQVEDWTDLAVRFLRCYMARGWPEVLDAASYLEGDKRFTKAQIAEALRRVEPSADSESGCERGGESGGMSGGMSGGESGSESGGESGGEMSESD